MKRICSGKENAILLSPLFNRSINFHLSNYLSFNSPPLQNLNYNPNEAVNARALKELTVNIFQAPSFCSKCAASLQQHSCPISAVLGLLPFSAESGSPEWDPGSAHHSPPCGHVKRGYRAPAEVLPSSPKPRYGAWAVRTTATLSRSLTRPAPFARGFYGTTVRERRTAILSLTAVPCTASLLISLLQKLWSSIKYSNHSI